MSAYKRYTVEKSDHKSYEYMVVCNDKPKTCRVMAYVPSHYRDGGKAVATQIADSLNKEHLENTNKMYATFYG